jgi:hypothetical protein
MYGQDKLKSELHRRWENRFERIKAANQDFAGRIGKEQLIFELDTEDDSLVVTIGPRPEFVYTQGSNQMRLDMDESDRIVAITIEHFSEYVSDHNHPALNDLAKALRHLGRIEVPAGGRSEAMERELRDLVPA